MKSIYANGKRGRTAELLNRINFAMFKTFAVYLRILDAMSIRLDCYTAYQESHCVSIRMVFFPLTF